MLEPEIILYFKFTDGSQLAVNIDIKKFQELRKHIAYHINKTLENEAVNLLK